MRLFISAVFLFCSIAIFGQISSPFEREGANWDLDGIKGELASVEIKEHIAIDYFGELKKQTIKFEGILFFNSNNHRTKFEGIDYRNKFSINWIYKIDSMFVDIRTNGYSGEEKTNGRETWRYDSRGNIIEFISYENDFIAFKEFAKYNEKNLLIEHKKYGSDGKLESISSCIYDKNGNEIESTFLSDNWSGKSKKVYNQGNKIIEELLFDKNDLVVWSISYKYNNNGKLIEINESNEYVYKQTKTYNSNGEKTSTKSYNSKGEVLNNETFVYNAEGALVEEIFTGIFYGGDPKKTVASYEYDQKGNWTKKTEYSVSPPTALPSQYTITERKINYR